MVFHRVKLNDWGAAWKNFAKIFIDVQMIGLKRSIRNVELTLTGCYPLHGRENVYAQMF